MKMTMVVLVVRVIISMLEKDKKKLTVEKNSNRITIIHPAEFEIR
jgi:hypothetical protein